MCDGHNDTLVIVKDESDKVFGGFSALPWKSDEQWEVMSAYSMRHECVRHCEGNIFNVMFFEYIL